MSSAVDAVQMASDADPITAILTRDWAAVGGWSLFVGLCIFIVIGAFREWWVPGPVYRRLNESATKQSETLSMTVKALDNQVDANEIVKHFFEEMAPLRKEVGNEEVSSPKPPRRPRRFRSADV